MEKSVKPNKNQKAMYKLGKAVNASEPQSVRGKLFGILPAQYGGIDPITNLSYPKTKRKKR